MIKTTTRGRKSTATPTPTLPELREKLAETESMIQTTEQRLAAEEYDFLGALLKFHHRRRLTERERDYVIAPAALYFWRQEADRLRKQIAEAGETT